MIMEETIVAESSQRDPNDCDPVLVMWTTNAIHCPRSIDCGVDRMVQEAIFRRMSDDLLIKTIIVVGARF